MRRLSLVTVLCGVVVVGLVYGCGARVEVAKDRLRDKIDSLLGAMDVKRKEIELGVAGLKEGIDGLRRAKIRAQVSGEQLGRQAQPHMERLGNVDLALKTIRGRLDTDKPVDIAGKTYTATEIKEMANRILAARKTCVGQVEVLQSAVGRLNKVSAMLERRQTEAQERLANIEGQLAIIDSNRIALTAMRESAEAMGGDNRSLTQGLDHLAAKVNDLFADVETELRVEDERWGAAAASKEIDTVDAMVAKTRPPRDPGAEIDRILSLTK